MRKKDKKSKKALRARLNDERLDKQSFFFIGSISELIILSVLIVLVVAYFSVFSADGFVFTRILQKEKGKDMVPDKRQVISRLEAEKIRTGKYPYNIKVVGVNKRYGSTRIEYVSSGQEFELCYSYFPYIENTASCYTSQTGQWK